jgi:hypothetical protein
MRTCKVVDKPRSDLHLASSPLSSSPNPPYVLLVDPVRDQERLQVGNELTTSPVIMMQRVPEGLSVETDNTIYLLHGVVCLPRVIVEDTSGF